MRKITEIVRLREDCGWSYRRIGAGLNISKSAAHKLAKRAREAGIGWPLPDGVDEAGLARLVHGDRPPASDPLQIDFEWVSREMQRKGVTLKLLWQELCERGYPHGYAWFCRCCQQWERRTRRTMRQRYRLGEAVFVDYAGATVGVSGRKAQIFVAALGVSHYIHAEASWTQKVDDWLASCTRMFEYFGGATQMVVPDNLKSAVTRHRRYDPELNPNFRQWSDHYATAIVPARPARPRDKAIAENAVQQVTRWIIAPLRDREFESLSELNGEIRRLLETVNGRPFSARPGSRTEVFEQQERAALRALPLLPYRHIEVRTAKVGFDYHVSFDHHWYSVPHQHVGGRVRVHSDGHTVQVYSDRRRIAMHARSDVRGGHTTCEMHMPDNHAHRAKWTPQRVRSRASRVGPHCSAWVGVQLDGARHFHQVSRRLVAVLSLGSKYGDRRLDDACALAGRYGLSRMNQISEILESGADLRRRDQCELTLELAQDHENVRGAAAFE